MPRSVLLPGLLFLALTTSLMAGPVEIKWIQRSGTQTLRLPGHTQPDEAWIGTKELANSLNLRTYYNPSTRVLQIYFSRHQLKIESGNPWLVLESLTGGTPPVVIQCPGLLSPADGVYQIPLTVWTAILSRTIEGYVEQTGTSQLLIRERMFDLNSLLIEEKTNGTLVRIPLLKPLADFENRTDESGMNYLTLVDIQADVDAINKTQPTGLVRSVQARPLPNGSLQLMVKVNPQEVTGVDIEYNRKEAELLMSVRKRADSTRLEPMVQAVPVNNDPHLRERWALDVIVLDAGHGGKDPGAIGKKGTREKDVTLGVVKKLGARLKKEFPDIKVVYTRDDDFFVSLSRRGKIANEAKGKLFVSVHCNSNKKRSVDGVETYFLGLHKTDDAMEVASRENNVIFEEENYEEDYKNFTEENLILLSMAQSAFLEQSEKIAMKVTRNIASMAKRDNRGVKQAGFMVLWTPSMPSILVETGYLSNANEEKFLASKDGQQKIADAIFESIRQYKEDYEKSLGYSDARAQE
ncbi:MAG: N-acetylmuramoyl-L-alanine amidase [Bacteroidetes bacterium]|nr:N-acetylmuramoyl-L-alanine amidase [Bacteroidota bacterium]